MKKDSLMKPEDASLKYPVNWALSTLGEVGDYINGRPFKPSEWEDEGKPIIRIQNLTKSTSTVNYYSGPVKEKYLIKDGDFLISWSATLGTYIYRGREAVLNQHIFKVKPFVDKLFLYYSVTNILQEIKNKIHGTGMQHITKKKFEETAILIPPLPEQRRIALKIDDLFSKLDAGLESIEKIKKLLKRCRQSVLKYAFEGTLTEEWRQTNKHKIEPVSVLLEQIQEERNKKEGKHREPSQVDTTNLSKLPESWLWTSLDSLLSDARYGTSKKCYASPHGIPVLRIPNVVNGVLNFDNLKYTELKEEKLKRLTLNIGDLLVVRTNGSLNLVGRTSVISRLPEKFAFASYLIRLRPLCKDILPQYLVRVLSSRVGRVPIERKARTTAGQYNVNLKTLRSIPIPLPPYSEMQHIVNKIDSLFSIADEVERRIELSLMKSECLHQSILRTAFEGNLIPQNPSDEPAEKLLERIRKNKEKVRSEEKRNKKTKSKRKSRQKQSELVHNAQ